MSSSGHNDYVASLKMAISELFNSEKISKYYYKLDDDEICSDELQPDFNEPGVFFTEDLEIKIFSSSKAPSALCFILFNYNVYMDSDDDFSSCEEAPYDTIVVNEKGKTIIIPFRCEPIKDCDTEYSECFNDILKRTIVDINDIKESILKGTPTKQKTHPF